MKMTREEQWALLKELMEQGMNEDEAVDEVLRRANESQPPAKDGKVIDRLDYAEGYATRQRGEMPKINASIQYMKGWDDANSLKTVTPIGIEGSNVTDTRWDMQPIESLAEQMIADGMDYMEVSYLKPGHMLAAYSDGVWIVDTNQTCVMENMTRVTKVIDGPL